MLEESNMLVNLYRGVARYLKNLFDQESGGRRKSVDIDHLLAGKSRKEASRMFFETLVRQSSPRALQNFISSLDLIFS